MWVAYCSCCDIRPIGIATWPVAEHGMAIDVISRGIVVFRLTIPSPMDNGPPTPWVKLRNKWGPIGLARYSDVPWQGPSMGARGQCHWGPEGQVIVVHGQGPFAEQLAAVAGAVGDGAAAQVDEVAAQGQVALHVDVGAVHGQRGPVLGTSGGSRLPSRLSGPVRAAM